MLRLDATYLSEEENLCSHRYWHPVEPSHTPIGLLYYLDKEHAPCGEKILSLAFKKKKKRSCRMPHY
jgi:hypothetical protein